MASSITNTSFKIDHTEQKYVPLRHKADMDPRCVILRHALLYGHPNHREPPPGALEDIDDEFQEDWEP